MSEQKWHAKNYQNNHAFVYHYGEGVIELLAPKKGEKILDIGCGTGYLTNQIFKTGAVVSGIDASENMLMQASSNYPEINFSRMNVLELSYQDRFDAIFSNAVMHWIEEDNQLKAVKNISKALKSGGRYVAEFGGFRCCEMIYDALSVALAKRGYKDRYPFYFPKISTYTTLLESQGLLVSQAYLFDRKTVLENNDQGLSDWIRMFQSSLLDYLPQQVQIEVLEEVNQNLKETWLYDKNNQQWYADYVRIRVVAYKE